MNTVQTEKILKSHIAAANQLLSQTKEISEFAEIIISTIKNQGKILIAGNGGSAADSQHMAAEFLGRFKKNRKPIAAISLTTDTSIITAIGNDFGFKTVFAKQIQALGNEKDIFVIFSTSGKSENLIEAINAAKNKGIKTLALLGKDGGTIKDIADKTIIIENNDTARIQEMHITIIHVISEIVEDELFPS